MADPADQIFLLSCLHLAARKSEIIGLRWDDVDLEGRKIRLWTRKRKDGRREPEWLPLTTELSTALASLKATTSSLHVFTWPRTGNPYKYRKHLMGHLCRLAGVKPFGFHAIRHLSASILDQAGQSLSTIQAILRHKSATTTARYLHSLRGTQAAVDEVFGGRILQFRKPTASKTASVSGDK